MLFFLHTHTQKKIHAKWGEMVEWWAATKQCPGAFKRLVPCSRIPQQCPRKWTGTPPATSPHSVLWSVLDPPGSQAKSLQTLSPSPSSSTPSPSLQNTCFPLWFKYSPLTLNSLKHLNWVISPSPASLLLVFCLHQNSVSTVDWEAELIAYNFI